MASTTTMSDLQSSNLYDFNSEASKIIALRDQLVDQAEKSNLLTADSSDLTPDLIKFRNRYRRLVIEKRINKRRENDRFKAAYRADGKLHLLPADEVQDDEEYNKQLKLALEIGPPVLTPVAPANLTLSRPPPPPLATVLPYEDDINVEVTSASSAGATLSNTVDSIPGTSLNPPQVPLPKPHASSTLAPPAVGYSTAMSNNSMRSYSGSPPAPAMVPLPTYSDHSPNLPETTTSSSSVASMTTLPPLPPPPHHMMSSMNQPNGYNNTTTTTNDNGHEAEYKPPVFNRQAYIQHQSSYPQVTASPPPVMMYSDDRPVPVQQQQQQINSQNHPYIMDPYRHGYNMPIGNHGASANSNSIPFTYPGGAAPAPPGHGKPSPYPPPPAPPGRSSRPYY